ncbi:hypothetical protein ACLQ2N_09795 [Streptomyces sp. DT224]|uniref:hypothetical protein n=1 Tax=Streptomyces sp. DT224 TaxID=3393426 RepID=UPI003CF40B89
MPVEEHGTAPAPGPLPTRTDDEDPPSRELRRDPDLSRYASLAAFPPCRCGAPICPDGPARAGASADDIRVRVRETNAMHAKYRL